MRGKVPQGHDVRAALPVQRGGKCPQYDGVGDATVTVEEGSKKAKVNGIGATQNDGCGA